MTKQATILTSGEHAVRLVERDGLAQLDQMTEALPGLTRVQRDANRITPRDVTNEVSHPKLQRPLPTADQVRQPFSSRQKKARSKTRYDAQSQMSDATYRAQRELMTKPATWERINNSLSDAVGDVQALPAADQRRVRQIDRSIQTYEAANDRGHVVYANIAMPHPVNHANLEAFVRNSFGPGRTLYFDRYTFARHQLHEATHDRGADPGGRVAVFEIHTRRGAYLGHSDSRDDTAHLLPRGFKATVVGAHQATYVAPDGSTGTRFVIQLRDE